MSSLFMRIWMRFIGVKCEGKVNAKGFFVILKRKSAKISISENFTVKSFPFSNLIGLYQRTIIVARKDGCIKIGRNVGLSGVTIHGTNITIGDYVAVGANTKIIDHDFHSLNYLERRTDDTSHEISKPVIIGNDVFIGCNCLILKGTTIGDRCIVGAGSVVSGSFPDDSVIAGNPARIIKKVNN